MLFNPIHQVGCIQQITQTVAEVMPEPDMICPVDTTWTKAERYRVDQTAARDEAGVDRGQR